MDQKLDFSQNLTLFDKLCSKSETNINLNVDKDNKSIFDSFKNENNNLFFRKKEDNKKEENLLNKKRPCEITKVDKDSKPKLINNNAIKSNKNIVNERVIKLKKKEIIETITGNSIVVTQDMVDLMKRFVKNYEENKENEEKNNFVEGENRDLKNKIEILQNELNEKNKNFEDARKYEKNFIFSEEKLLKVEKLFEKEKEINKNINSKNSDQIFEIFNLKQEIEKSNEIKLDNQSQIVKLKKELDSTLKHNTIVEDLTIRLQNTINTIQIEFKEKYTLLISEKLKAEDLLDHFRKEFINLPSNKR